MKRIIAGYIVALIVIISLWYAIIPTQEELMESQAGTKFATAVRSLETQIVSRFGQVDMKGNLTYTTYTYREANVTGFELSDNDTVMTLYFMVSSTIRVKRFGMVIDEYAGENQTKSIIAYRDNRTWELDPTTVKDLD